jgi:hypothetical protein
MVLTNHPIFVVIAVAVVAPLLAEIPIGVRVPTVVLEVVLGILIGPHVLGLVQRGLVDQYTLPSAGAVINFISQASIQGGRAPDGSPIMQMSGRNVVNPGDTFYLAVNPTTLQTRQIQVSTTQ